MAKFSVSEPFARKVLDQHRSTQRKRPGGKSDEEAFTADIIRPDTAYASREGLAGPFLGGS